ncbi:MAG: thioredoxin domain-containing protein [Candidatus Omnitrophica bacterium]|nr:thioredoxin domain-containing protein [Candidatus Omnitrophota bacterium]
MQKKVFTLVLVVTIGVLTGVAVVKKQTREPLLREILKGQQILLLAQTGIERKLGSDADRVVEDLVSTKRFKGLEDRIASLKNQIKSLQEAVKKAGRNTAGTRQAPPPEDPSKIYTIPVAHSPVKGNKKAFVTIVEFVDFQCPFCARFHPPIVEVLKAYPKDVNYVLKNFPLAFHSQAKPAAKAAFAAGEQGKYWEMVDVLLENGKSLNVEMFEKFAGEIGLDVTKFLDDYKNKDAKWEGYIGKDMALALQVGVRGTPTFFINGRKTRARDFNSLKKEIDQILNEKK